MISARARGRRANRTWLLTVPAVAFLLVVFFVPVVYVLTTSVTDPSFGLGNYGELFSTGYLRLAWRTLWIALAATVICLALGYPVAYAIIRSSPLVRVILIVGVASPYLTSALVRTFSWQVLLGRLGPIPEALRWIGIETQGLLDTWIAVLVGLVHILLPLMVLSLVAVMSRVDLSILRASRSLGAGPAESFWRAFVPLTLPGIEVGSVLCFALGIGSFIQPAILGGQDGQMLGQIVESSVNEFAEIGFAAAISVLLAVAVAVALAVYRWGLSGRMEWLSSREAVTPSAPRRTRRGHSRLAWVAAAPLFVARLLDRTGLSRMAWIYKAFAGVVVFYMAIPQLVTIPVSLSGTRELVFPPKGLSTEWYGNFFTDEWLQPLWTSLIVAGCASLIATVLAALAAFGAERGLGPRLRGGIGVVMLMPLVLPLVVVATGFYIVFVRIGLTDTRFGLVLAHTCLVIPYAFALLSATVRGLDVTYERAALSLGDSRLRVVRRIVVPLLLPGLVVAFLLSFLTSFDEAVVAIFISGLYVTTLPRQMFEAVLQQGDPTIGVVGTVSLVASLLIAGLAWAVQRRSRRRIGRNTSQ